MSIFTLMFFYQGTMKKVDAAEATNSFDYMCIADTSFGVLEIGMKVTPTITVPDTVEPNSTLNVENISTDIEIDLTGTLNQLRGLINPFEGQVNHFYVEVDGEEENVVGSEGTAIPSTPHESGDDFVPFTVLGNDTAFTVGEDDVEIVAGEIEAVIESSLADIPVQCNPTGDNVITTVTVEEEEEPGEPEDDVAPVITLNGDNPMEIEGGYTYDEQGATVEDDVDGDLSDAIEISGDVNTEEAGEYEVVYTVSDAAENEATETRIVHVVDPDEGEEPGEPEDDVAPVITLHGDNPM